MPRYHRVYQFLYNIYLFGYMVSVPVDILSTLFLEFVLDSKYMQFLCEQMTVLTLYVFLYGKAYLVSHFIFSLDFLVSTSNPHSCDFMEDIVASYVL